MEQYREIAEKVMDKLVTRLELSIMKIERLNQINWSRLKDVKKETKDAKNALEKMTETLAQHRLACEDIKFFSHLIAGRTKQVETVNPHRFDTSPASKGKDILASPWGMMKHFDSLYNNQDKRIEQRVDKRLQGRFGTPNRKSPDINFKYAGPSFTSGGGACGETRIFALDSTSEALIPSILVSLGEVSGKTKAILY